MSSLFNLPTSIMNGSSSIQLKEPTSSLLASRQLRDPVSSSSPLQIFVRAKKKINDVYQEIEEYVGETSDFISNIPKEKSIITEDNIKEIQSFASKVAGIKEILSRDHMKVAFFGRTSNGKSTVINAMLGDKILPSGIGHTTNCFLQVEGDESMEPYLVKEGSSDRQNIGNITTLAHALCNNSMGDSSLVKIHWPKHRCQLLRDDVILVDSPGIDVTDCLDEWIDKHCLDADVFVLVANSESTLMNTEKKFFYKVSTKLSKPNIFVLQNRWDMAAAEPEYLNEVKKQHTDRTLDFLINELKVADEAQALKRVFFVSAKEVLNRRLNEARGTSSSNNFVDGYSGRYLEFQEFERQFEECISKSAIITKFNQHSQRGVCIASDIEKLVGQVQDRAIILKDKKIENRRNLYQQLDTTEKEMDDLTAEMKDKICHIVEDVERRVSSALNEEIRRLSVLVDEFNEPFHPDPLVVSVYKKTLHSHVESGLGSNLRSRLSSALAVNMQSSQQEMTKRMIGLLPENKVHLANTLMPRREPFEILYRLNCENLCSDFQEDVKFKFSLGLISLVYRFMGKASSKIVNSNHKESMPRSVSMTPLTPMTPSNEIAVPITNDDWTLISKYAMASVGSHGTMGVVLALGLMFKTVGWRLVVATASLYGILYAYERLSWTTNAKERLFKKQYVEHATKKLRLIVDLTSHNCSHQVQQELSGTFARLCRIVDESTNEMHKELRSLEREVQMLDDVCNNSKKLRNKANYIIGELSIFNQSYLNVK